MDKALQTMIDNMPEKTGKSLNEWKSLLKTMSFSKHSEAVNFLKKEHQVTHGFANTIVTLSKEENIEPSDLVNAQYTGKEGLLPIYKSLLNLVKGFGTDVTISPKKTSVSIIRKKQFLIGRNFTDKEVLGKDFLLSIDEAFIALRPFFNYMSDVLTTDLNGESLI